MKEVQRLTWQGASLGCCCHLVPPLPTERSEVLSWHGLGERKETLCPAQGFVCDS